MASQLFESTTRDNRRYGFVLEPAVASGSLLSIPQPIWPSPEVKATPSCNVRSRSSLPTSPILVRPFRQGVIASDLPTTSAGCCSLHHFFPGLTDIRKYDAPKMVNEADATEKSALSDNCPRRFKGRETLQGTDTTYVYRHGSTHKVEAIRSDSRSQCFETTVRICEEQVAGQVDDMSTHDIVRCADGDNMAKCRGGARNNLLTDVPDAHDKMDIMSIILSALHEDSCPHISTFEYESDGTNTDVSRISDSSPAPSLSFLDNCDALSSSGSKKVINDFASPPSTGFMPMAIRKTSILPMTIDHDSNDEVIISPAISTRTANRRYFAPSHRRTGAMDVNINSSDKLLCPKHRQAIEDPLEVPMFVDNSIVKAPGGTKWSSSSSSGSSSTDVTVTIKVFVPSTDDMWKFRVPWDICLKRFTSKVLSKLGFHVAFSGSCFDDPDYYFRTDEAFRTWIGNHSRSGRNIPIVGHLVDPPRPTLISTMDAHAASEW